MGFFKSKSVTYDPMSAYTPQQRSAVQALMDLAATGSGGGITLGQRYTGSLGDFTQSDTSTQALNALEQLINGSGLQTAESTLSRLSNNVFNPDDPSSGYAAFSRALAKAGTKSADILNREAAITGSRYGTGIQQRKEELAQDLANQRGMFLADLFNRGENRALQASMGLGNLESTKAGLLNNLFSLGDFQRQLNTQKAQAELEDFKRARNEELMRLNLMGTQMNNPLGTITYKKPSAFSKVAPVVGGVLGTMVGGPLGGMIGSSLGGAVGGASSGSGFSPNNMMLGGLLGNLFNNKSSSPMGKWDTSQFSNGGRGSDNLFITYK